MENFPILQLPEEIQAMVVERVARNSIRSLCYVRESSKLMKALADRRRVYYFYDLLAVPWKFTLHTVPLEFLRRCYAERNPSTLYIKGVQFVYTLGRKEEGLALIKEAADAGYELAVYTHAMTQKIFWDDGEYLYRLPREWMERMGREVRSVKCGWGLWHCTEFCAMKEFFVNTILLSFYWCNCAPLRRSYDDSLWHIERTKDDNMCQKCFLIKEFSLFLRDFEPISRIIDTTKW